MSSVYTKIIDGVLPGRFAWADDVCVAIATIAPITSGHMLVVPREVTEKFTDLPENVLAHLAVVAKHIGRAQEVAFQAPRAAVIVAGFEVPHTHIHVLPAWSEKALSFDNANENVPDDHLDADTEAVRRALRDAGHGAHVPTQMDSPDLD